MNALRRRTIWEPLIEYDNTQTARITFMPSDADRQGNWGDYVLRSHYQSAHR